MTGSTIAARIVEQAQRVGVAVPPPLGASLAAYLELLARWNRKINLTALDVASPGDEAIDRLIVEPLVAAAHVRASDDLCVDVGSGGGSPAIPLKLAVPSLRLVLVEVKTRKSAFLREVIRQLGLSGVEVENCRFEDLASRPQWRGAVSLVTIRAVRVDPGLLGGIAALLKPGGRVFWFDSTDSESPGLPHGLAVELTLPLNRARRSILRILTADTAI